MSDERHDGDETGADDAAPADDALEPATWAGRQQWQGLPDDVEDPDGADAGEHELPPVSDQEEDAPPAAEGEEPDEPEGDGETAAAPEEASGDSTIETDTLALADVEEAREAALAGLRARTKEHAAKRGIAEPPAQEKPPAKPKPPAKETISSETAPVAAAPAGDEPSAEEQTAPKAGLWARFVAASFLIIVSMATATAVSILVYLTDIAKGLGGLEGLQGQLAEIDTKAQNFLILGSDARPQDGNDRGRSDTTMLLRVDPDGGLITQLSIPRDLKVNIPGHGVDKFNAAYSYGGPELTLEVVKKSITGDRVPIHHVVNIDFNGFADAVNAIDCVYVDVDRHYFNSNEGLAAIDQYAEIDIEAGYQRLCGLKALQYVRYRHEDNDLVRGARQQGFLREARQKVPPDKLLDDRAELIEIFTKYTTSDINNSGILVELFKLMLDARNAQVNQITFRTTSLGDESGYVTASDDGLNAAIDELLGVGGATAPEPDDDSGGGDGANKGSGGRDGKQDEPDKPAQPPPPEMLDSTVSGQQYAAAIQSQSEGELKFPVLYPTRITPSGTITDASRFFRIDGPGNNVYRGYKFVMSFPSPGGFTGYYGVSGTNWRGAPLFENPSEVRKVGERTYSFYYDAGALRMVAFEREGAKYWVTNSLDKILTEPQMLAIAQNLAVAGGG